MKLFVDSSTNILYVDVVTNDNKVLSFNRIGKNDHSEMMISTIEEFFKEHSLNINDVEEIYVGRGPGSYTGLRISGTFGKVLSLIKNIKLYSFSTLDYLLYSKPLKDGKYMAKVIAKKGHSYLKGIEVVNQKFHTSLEECFKNDEILEEYKEYEIIEELDINRNPINLIDKNLVTIEDTFEYTPNYIRSEFN